MTKSNTKPDTVQQVVRQGLCTQCGSCVAVCPVHAIEMRETPSCLLTPSIAIEKCVDCGKCLKMPSDGSLRPKPALARTRQEILGAQGSKYCPVATNAGLQNIAASERVAAVSLSCHIHGIHKLAQHCDSLVKGTQYRIGIFCDRTLMYTCIDQMISSAGLNREKIAGLLYRSKVRNLGQDEVRFLSTSGENAFCDIACGDPHGVGSEPGESVVIVRNAKGKALLEEACRYGHIALRPVPVESIFEGQLVEHRRRDFVAYSDVWRGMGRTLPEYHGIAQRFLPPVDHDTRHTCQRRLLLNCRVIESKTAKDALFLARRQRQFDHATSLGRRLLGKIKKVFLVGSKK